MDTNFIHPTADVQSAKIGAGTRIWQFVVVLPDCTIGTDCNICAHCFFENDVVVGNRVTIKCGVQLWDGLRIGDDVFVGPNVSFTNDKFPRSKNSGYRPLATEIEDGASIGAGAVVLPGIRIGRNAMIGSGSVVTRSVPPNAIVVGNPARVVGYVGASSKSSDQIPGKNQPASSKATRVKGVNLHALPLIEEIRGSLSVGEFGSDLPFEAKRFFIVCGVPNLEIRGQHTHRECHEFLICTHGQCTVVVDDGTNREEFLLDRPNIGLHLPPMVWATEYAYSSDASLLVFASHLYEAKDYIRDYDEFLSLVRTSG